MYKSLSLNSGNAEVKDLKKKLKGIRNDRSVIAEQLSNEKETNIAIHTQYVQMIAALYDEVPAERREHLFEKTSMLIKNNIIPIRE